MSDNKIENYNSVASIAFAVCAFLLFFILSLIAIVGMRSCAPIKADPRADQRIENRENLSATEEELLAKIGIEGESSRRSLVEGLSSLEKRSARRTSILDPSSPTSLNPPVEIKAPDDAESAQAKDGSDVVEISADPEQGEAPSSLPVLPVSEEASEVEEAAEGAALDSIIEATKTIITAPAEAIE